MKLPMSEFETVVPYRANNGQFVLGHTGIGGRPKGSRNLLAEAMIDDLLHEWKAHGIQAIRDCRERSPVDFLKIVAMIISKAESVPVD